MKNCYKTVNLTHLKKNIKFLKNKTKNSKFCAVVKSDAYGHGIGTICPAIKNSVDYFAVSDNSEAIRVKKLCPATPCLILGPVSKDGLSEAINSNATFSIQNLSELKMLNSVAQKLNKIAYFHLQINTGMNRYGVPFDSDLSQFLRGFSHAKLAGIYSHLGSSETPDTPRTQTQIERFESATSRIPRSIIRHIFNTHGTLSSPLYTSDMVRCGLGIYGFGNVYLQPIMNIYAKIIAIQEVEKGDYLGYGLGSVAPQNMRVATIAIGYAHGLPRLWSKAGFVLVGGKKAKIVANICMEATIIDLSHLPAKIGDYVTVLGDSPVLNAETIAHACHTIPYEILTNFRQIAQK